MYVPATEAYTLAVDLADFWKTVTWFRMYCAGAMGKQKADYQKGFKSVKEKYKKLIDYKYIPKLFHTKADELFVEIDEEFKSLPFESRLSKISNLLFKFEAAWEEFNDAVTYARLMSALKEVVPLGLHDSAIQLLDHGEYDSMIVECFKYLDKTLQSLLFLTVQEEQYGENLINYAFSSKAGKFQLNTSENEQIGIRNFFSGANALFRNPAAHRELFKGENSLLYGDDIDNAGATIYLMTSMMSRIIYSLYVKKIDRQIDNALLQFSSKLNLPFVISNFTFGLHSIWGIRFVGDKQPGWIVQIKLLEDYKGPLFELFAVATIPQGDIENLKTMLVEISKLRVKLVK